MYISLSLSFSCRRTEHRIPPQHQAVFRCTYLAESMRKRPLIISSVIFIVASFSFAINSDKIYNAGLDEQKGDYISFCIKISLLLSFLYMIAVRISLPKLYSIILIFIGPLISIFVSFILTLILSGAMEDTRDQKLLALFLFLQSILPLLIILPFVISARQRSKQL